MGPKWEDLERWIGQTVLTDECLLRRRSVAEAWKMTTCLDEQENKTVLCRIHWKRGNFTIGRLKLTLQGRGEAPQPNPKRKIFAQRSGLGHLSEGQSQIVSDEAGSRPSSRNGNWSWITRLGRYEFCKTACITHRRIFLFKDSLVQYLYMDNNKIYRWSFGLWYWRRVTKKLRQCLQV